ncbi:ketosynthase chain-length factor [Streptomyces bottropensis]|uniref:Keto-acyl synthase beta n=2 Tax=Streptomyces bottropensis TaxID=42235 RepID=M3FMK6_9ACTN|nr:ketosynthase chain-length factor [Streptomyces bottropensis]AHL46709.1 ketosynthase [Streptomyces bottropensis]EMF53324.1 keto-acyl synthase beta [Streptomyces bottropensis ATCC 25435]MZD17359.1 ketosynthase chain-length factor [Streptomyces sp. SID5476]
MTATATRPVITGLGVAAPTGLGTDAHWSAVVEGTNGIAEITRFDASGYRVRLAGEVPGFEASAHIPSRLLPQTDHMTRLALYAADEALKDSGIDLAALAPYEAGVSSASSMGGFEFGQRELQNLWSKGGQFVSAYQSFAWFYAVNTGQISIRHGLKGPSSAVVTDQAGGLDAIGHARRQIRKGTKVMLAGGVDGALCPLGLAGQLASGRLSTENRPDRAYLPFDEAASGHVPGEGGAYLVLEDPVSAEERGARVHGELAGYAATFDPDPRDPGADGLERAIRAALADADRTPDTIAVVFADAAGVPEADRAEAAALAAVFGPRGVRVAVPKAQTGRLYAGGGALDLASALLVLRDGSVPPTAHVTSVAADCPVDLVTGEARTLTGDAALVLARGEGGFNAAAVVTRAN